MDMTSYLMELPTMPTWTPHTETPDGPTAAVVAIYLHEVIGGGDPAADDGQPFLLGEVFRWDTSIKRWIGENSGLLLKVTPYWWAAETEILAGMPRP